MRLEIFSFESSTFNRHYDTKCLFKFFKDIEFKKKIPNRRSDIFRFLSLFVGVNRLIKHKY